MIGDAPGTPAHNYQSTSYIHGRGDEMLHGFHDVRVRQLVKSATAAFRVNDWALNQIDPDRTEVRGHHFCQGALVHDRRITV